MTPSGLGLLMWGRGEDPPRPPVPPRGFLCGLRAAGLGVPCWGRGRYFSCPARKVTKRSRFKEGALYRAAPSLKILPPKLVTHSPVAGAKGLYSTQKHPLSRCCCGHQGAKRDPLTSSATARTKYGNQLSFFQLPRCLGFLCIKIEAVVPASRGGFLRRGGSVRAPP